MRINHNIAALNTYRQLTGVNTASSKSLEKLSSGYRINRAGDDAAGLAISEKMRGQIRGLDQASRNAQDGISMIQTAEGGLNETHSILQRMRELAVQASNDTMEAGDRTAIGEELKSLCAEIDRIGNTTQFNGKNLLNGSLSTSIDATSTLEVGDTLATAVGVTIAEISVSDAAGGTTYTFSGSGTTLTLTGNGKTQSLTVGAMTTAESSQELNFADLGISVKLVSQGNVAATGANIVTDVGTAGLTVVTAAGSTSATFAIGANSGQTMNVSFSDMRASELGDASDLNTLVGTVAANSVVDTVAKAQTLITEMDAAIVDVSSQRGVLGAAQNRLEHTINNLNTSAENLTASESRIRDVDMAKEMMEFTKNNILSQAATAMLAQANQQPQMVLQLLQ